MLKGNGLLTRLLEGEDVDKILRDLPFRPQALKSGGGLPEPLMMTLNKHIRSGNLSYLGEGASRATYQTSGGNVLKVAMNQSGIIQNRQEVQVWKTHGHTGWVARVFRWDPKFQWIIMEEVEDQSGLPSELFKPIPKEGSSEYMDARMYFMSAGRDSYRHGMGGLLPSPLQLSFYEFLRDTGLLFREAERQSGRTSSGKQVIYDFGFGRSLSKFWEKNP